MSSNVSSSHVSLNTKSVSRRKFLAGSAVAAPMILGSGVLAFNGRPGANDRINIGMIGVGGKGTGNMRMVLDKVVAVCDVDQDHIKKALGVLKRDVPVYTDYRELLERKDIDAVVISSPDHWHGLQTVHACQAGKDVYVEKPACKYVEEGRAMAIAASKYGRVVQVGSQGRNHPAAGTLRAFLQGGNIGNITEIECWHNDNPVGGDPTKRGTPPASLDWDKWVGPAAMRPYNPDYCHRNFRWMLDLGGGQIRDRGAHVFNLISWFMGLDRTGPDTIVAGGNVPTSGLWNCPTEFHVEYTFKKPKLTVKWAQPGIQAADFDFGAVYRGTRGQIIVRGGDGRVFLDEQVTEYAKDTRMPFEGPKGNYAGQLHMQNWLDCIKSREAPDMDMESGHRVASMCILANLAYRLERPLQWDASKELFIGDPGADLLLGSPGRRHYHIGKI